MSTPADPALFLPDGDGWVPTGSSRGPWNPDALHGGPVAALMVRALEQLEAPVPMRLVRVTVELLRPVGLEPLLLDASVTRPGGKVGVLDAELRRASDGTPLVLARALRIREAPVEFPDPGDDDLPELPDVADEPAGWPGLAAYHTHAVEHRYLRGRFGDAGPMFDWMRLRVPVVPGEDPSPWQRAVAAADFGNGLSSLVPFDGSALFINPDLTVQLWREPVGEWIGVDAASRSSGTGIGVAGTRLWDRSGSVGTGLQSLLLDVP